MKWLNKWLRRVHRWIAVPTALLIPVAVVLKFSGTELLANSPALEKAQSLLILAMALSGAYLFLLPYFSRWKRKRRLQNGSTRSDVS